jgi:hypothetical protein
MGPPTLFTIPVLRYMKTYGLTHEQLAMVSVVQREWAAKNPRATFKTPITVEDVLNSRMIAYPFRLLQCCLVTDGGGALILVSAERARDFPQKPVYLLGTGESVETPMVSSPVIPAKAGIQDREDFSRPLDPRFRGGDDNPCRAARPVSSSPSITPPPAASSRSTPMAAVFPTCIPACTPCRRACARCAAPPPPRSRPPKSRSATASAACSL